MKNIDKYNDLYETVSFSMDHNKIHIFGEAEKWAFAQINDADPQLAQQWLERIDAVRWNNYLTEAEASAITSRIIGHDGKPGPAWDVAQVEESVRAFDGSMEQSPYFNRWALYVVMCMIIAAHQTTLESIATDGGLMKLVYCLAVEKLKDMNRREFIRPYFGL